MAWNTVWPEGNKSVKANITRGVNNMAYINVTMGGQAPIGTVAADTPDHFWARNNYDRHHRFIQMPGFVDGAFAPATPVLDAGQDGVIFTRLVNADVGKWELFYRTNSNTTYQISPCYETTTVNVNENFPNAGFVTVSAIPPNVYGEIVARRTSGTGSNSQTSVSARFMSDATIVQGWTKPDLGGTNLTTQAPALRFLNGSSATDLNLKVQASDSSLKTNYTFYITYRSL